MNKHFKDAGYYLRRAGEHTLYGIRETVEPVEHRLRTLIGREKQPEPTRVEVLLEDAKAVEQKAQGEARTAVGTVRQRVRRYRSS